MKRHSQLKMSAEETIDSIESGTVGEVTVTKYDGDDKSISHDWDDQILSMMAGVKQCDQVVEDEREGEDVKPLLERQKRGGASKGEEQELLGLGGLALRLCSLPLAGVAERRASRKCEGSAYECRERLKRLPSRSTQTESVTLECERGSLQSGHQCESPARVAGRTEGVNGEIEKIEQGRALSEGRMTSQLTHKSPEVRSSWVDTTKKTSTLDDWDGLIKGLDVEWEDSCEAKSKGGGRTLRRMLSTRRGASWVSVTIVGRLVTGRVNAPSLTPNC